MRSVADTPRKQLDEQMRRCSPEERVALALELGRDAVDVYAAYNGVAVEEARRVLELGKRRGRRPFSCLPADRP